MKEYVGLAVSVALAAFIARGSLRAFAEAGWTRANWRGEELPFPAGVIAVVAGILAMGLLVAAEHVLDLGIADSNAADQLVLVAGVAFLGLLDDLFEGVPRGWRGHFGAALRGGFSTGVLKAVGTLALALVGLDRMLHGEQLVSGVIVVVLATNFFNLLDLRPGRSAKAFVLVVGLLLLFERDPGPLWLIGPFVGPFIVLGLYDLRERCMLGDTGSNVMGAIAGLALVHWLGPRDEWIAAGVLLALTIFGEFRSISSTVDRLPPLRVLDSLGRRSDA
jgi:UDP-GlcNAc:undecaprenyl-phosphate/decaprenyl-phosphate GlcNAc-1-phosphate transferase